MRDILLTNLLFLFLKWLNKGEKAFEKKIETNVTIKEGENNNNKYRSIGFFYEIF